MNTVNIRKKFIKTSMLAIGIAIAFLYAFIVVGVDLGIKAYNDEVLNVLVEHHGSFGNDPSVENNKLFHFRLSKETPFETRYFTVEYINETTVVVHTDRISAVSPEEARTMADDIILKNRTSGTIENYRYVVSTNESSTIVIFVDFTRTKSLAMFINILSLVTCLLVFGFISIFVVMFSNKFTKPIEDNMLKQKGFITNAAHELKTPLTVISANNELIEMEYGENDSTIAINKQINKMNKMVRNMTALSSLDEKMDLDLKVPCNLSDIIIETLDSFKEIYDLNHISCDCKIEGNLMVTGDEKLLRQLFYILIENSNKYAKSFVNISLCKDKDKIYFEIYNDALSVEDGNLDKCFERFYRADDVRASDKEGSGIGLSIAKEVVNLHKGQIHAMGENNIFKIKISF